MNGNQKLPIANFRDQILATVAGSAVTIVTAETGAGKSTQVPQFLLDAGYNIVVTQPRRLAARTVAARVAFELGEKLGETVGVRTRDDRVDSSSTRCLFCTDGLALVRELMGVGRHGVLVLDEVHEWNLNIEVLTAWSKLQLGRGANFKVVLMSATLEAEKLAAYFGDAPVIAVPGRTFPVEERRPGRSVVEDAAALLREGRNVLLFQPGKAEIGQAVSELEKSKNVNAEILPLHGELSPEEQAACFRRYDRPKCVVATNVAQTSITIDDIDAVVDSGMERRIELASGVEGLYLKPISLADARQRKGRAGRTRPGIYIDHCPASDRLEFPKAEILRTRLDQTVLRLAEAGIDVEELDFFHQPDRREIHEAKRALKALGCMSANGEVTRIGRQVARMPVSVQYGRMVVEAERLGVVDDILTVAAILEVGEITARKDSAWHKLCTGEEGSDVMAQLAVFKAACNMTKEQMMACAVHTKSFFQAKDARRHLADALRGKVREYRSTGKREDIIRAVCAGMVDHLYHYNYGSYKNGDDQSRELAKESVVRSGGEWLVGLPFDLQIPTRRGGTAVLNLVRMATKVDPAMLAEVAPQLVEQKTGLSPSYDAQKDLCVSTTQVFFNGQMVREERIADPEHDQAADIFCQWLAYQMV